VAVSLLALSVALAEYRSARNAATRAVREMAEAEATAQVIARLQRTDRPPQAVLEGDVRMNDILERAMAEAGLKRIERIDPLPVTRLEQTDYKVTSTRVVLTDVSLYELVHFIQAVERAHVRLSDLRLTARSREAIAWQADLTFGVLVYAPLPGPEQ